MISKLFPSSCQGFPALVGFLLSALHQPSLGDLLCVMVVL